MPKEQSIPNTNEALGAEADRLSQLTPQDVLNIVSKAAQAAARAAKTNDGYEVFVAFNKALVAELGGNGGNLG